MNQPKLSHDFQELTNLRDQICQGGRVLLQQEVKELVLDAVDFISVDHMLLLGAEPLRQGPFSKLIRQPDVFLVLDLLIQPNNVLDSWHCSYFAGWSRDDICFEGVVEYELVEFYFVLGSGVSVEARVKAEVLWDLFQCYLLASWRLSEPHDGVIRSLNNS